VVVDGQSGPEYDSIIHNGPAFREGGSIQYLARKDEYLTRVRQPANDGNE
jgi:hypothetical protein